MKRTFVIALVAAAAVAATSFAYAAIPSASGVISACKDNKGTLKIIDAEAGQTCPGNQQLLSWSQQGPQGPPGPAGGPRYVSVDQSGTIDTANSQGFAGGAVTKLPGDENGGDAYCIAVPFDWHAVWVQHSYTGASVSEANVVFADNRTDDVCGQVDGIQQVAVWFSRPAGGGSPTTPTDFMLLFL